MFGGGGEGREGSQEQLAKYARKLCLELTSRNTAPNGMVVTCVPITRVARRSFDILCYAVMMRS